MSDRSGRARSVGEWRTVAFVFAGLCVVLAVAGAAFALAMHVLRHASPGDHDVGKTYATPRDMVTLYVPDGYQAFNSANSAVSESVTLARSWLRPSFSIRVVGSQAAADLDERDAATREEPRLFAAMLHCVPRDAPDTYATVRGRPRRIRVATCIGADGRLMRAETLTFRGERSTISVGAGGVASDFDERALHIVLSTIE